MMMITTMMTMMTMMTMITMITMITTMTMMTMMMTMTMLIFCSAFGRRLSPSCRIDSYVPLRNVHLDWNHRPSRLAGLWSG